jgi:histidinol-phosphate/aromatic aminotransferase/cobyric acid decarboxylase-like protein
LHDWPVRGTMPRTRDTEGAVDWGTLIRPELEPMRPYAPGLRGSEVRERSGIDHVLKLSSNEHPAGPFPAAIAAIAAIAPHLNRYPDGGCRALKRRLSTGVSRSASSP